jgi:protein O-GlcNAc transferase
MSGGNRNLQIPSTGARAAASHTAAINQIRNHLAANNFAAAEALCRKILATDPEQPDALHYLGLIALQMGHHKAAADLIGQALELRPNFFDALVNFATLRRAVGDLPGAIECLERVIQAQPRNATALSNLGEMLREANRLAEAEQILLRAIRVAPKHAAAHSNLGAVLLAFDRAEDSLKCFNRALALDPKFADAHKNLSAVLTRLGRPVPAEAAARKALAFSPPRADILNNLGIAILNQARTDEAISILQRAVELDSLHPDATYNLANALGRASRIDEASVAARQAAAARPHSATAAAMAASSALFVCDFATADAGTARIEEMGAAGKFDFERNAAAAGLYYHVPFLGLGDATRRQLQSLIEKRFVEESKRGKLARRAGCSGRPRIGYVSPNFGSHSIGNVLRPLFAAHDRSAVEIFAYSLVDRSKNGGPFYKSLREGAEHWIELADLDHLAAADRIAADHIDVLVDLTGYMHDARLEIFAQRPAPVQVYWLGHGGDLGLSFIDYIIGDSSVTPAGEDGRYIERIARLPEVFAPADTYAVPDVAFTRQQFGLEPEAVVFCAFNNSKKIDRKVFDCWTQILRAVPNSQLWLSNLFASKRLVANLQAATAAAGIDPHRLVFAAPVADKGEHLARHALADLFLDTFRVNAATTAIDALWAGLPVLTKRGDDFFSRISTSLLHSLEMPELIVQDEAAYVARAIALAQDPAARLALKARLKGQLRSSPLFDIDRFARHLERAFIHMTERARAGEAPASFDVPRLP